MVIKLYKLDITHHPVSSTNRLNFCLEILCISLDLIRARIKHKQHQCLVRPVCRPDESSNVATGNSTHKHRILSTLSFVNTQMVNTVDRQLHIGQFHRKHILSECSEASSLKTHLSCIRIYKLSSQILSGNQVLGMLVSGDKNLLNVGLCWILGISIFP